MPKDPKETTVNSQEKLGKPVETTQMQKDLAPEKLPKQHRVAEANPTLNKWAELIADSVENSIQSPTLKVSRFGLKTSKDVLAFLGSPAGKTVIAEIGIQLAAEKSLQEYEQLQLREKQLFMNRLKAAFFLWYIERKSHAAEQQRRIILEYNERAIKNSGHTTQPTTSLGPSSERNSLMRSIDDYNRAIQLYQNRETELQKEYEELRLELAKLEAEAHMIISKYDLYEQDLQDFDLILEKLENIPKLDDVQEDEEVIAEIQLRIDSVKEEMDRMLAKIDDLIKNKKDEDAALFMRSHASLGLNCARYFDMLAVRRGDKQYVTEDGKTELDGKRISYKVAYFILSKEQQIIKDGDKHYLLQPGQTWEHVSKDPKALEKARESFTQKKHELMLVESVVKHNKEFELKFNKEQTIEVQAKMRSNKEEQIVVKNQIILVQAAKASLQNLLDNPNLGLTPPRPTMAQGPSLLAPRPNFGHTAFYKSQLELEKFCKQPNIREILMAMAKQASPDNRQTAIAFLNIEFAKISPSGAPIPTVVMQRMLQTLGAWGVKPTKQFIPSIQQPADLLKEAEPKKELPSSSKLTPFSTNPFKWSPP